jgi:hypothetical protein
LVLGLNISENPLVLVLLDSCSKYPRWRKNRSSRLYICVYPEARDRICKRLRRPGIDSKESIPQAYGVWRGPDKSNRVVVPERQAGNRFLGTLKGLQIRALLYKSWGGLSNVFLLKFLKSFCQMYNKIHSEYVFLIFILSVYVRSSEFIGKGDCIIYNIQFSIPFFHGIPLFAFLNPIEK